MTKESAGTLLALRISSFLGLLSQSVLEPLVFVIARRSRPHETPERNRLWSTDRSCKRLRLGLTLPNATRVFYRGSGLAFCAVRRRMAAHLFSSSAIWRASSATPIPEIGVVRRNSASHVSKATLLLGIMQSFVFTVWSCLPRTLA